MIRKSKILVAGAPVLALILAAALGLSGSASAGAGPSAKPKAGSVVSNGVSAQKMSHWSKAQLKAAKPMKMTLSSSAVPGSAVAPEAGAIPGTEEGQAPSGSRSAARTSVKAVGVTPMAGGFTYPTPFTRYEVEKQLRKVYPYSTIGKLFFNQNGGSWVCSAAAISDQEIWTAGHCAVDGANHWSSNVVFIPGYRDGTKVKGWGQFSCNGLVSWSSWATGGDFRYDFASADCSTNGKGLNFASTTGWLGFAYNWAYGFHYDDFGYPAEPPFNGERMQRCESSYGHNDTRMAAPQPQAIGCDMTGGSSGGPWIWQFGTGNYINGENSYKYTTPSEPLEMNSPYYGNEALAVWDVVVE